MRFDRRLLGWGAFLLIAGAIPLLVRAGLVPRESVADWVSLWPLLLVGSGLGLILRHTPIHLLGGAVSVLTAGAMLGGALTAGFGGLPAFGGCGTSPNATAFEERSGALGESATMTVDFNCGSLDVQAVDGDAWALTGRGPSGKGPEVRADASQVRMSFPEDPIIAFTDASSTWHVRVPRTPQVDLAVSLNAGEGSLDLAGARIGAFTLTVNAGTFSANLAGTAAARAVDVTVNAGSATVSLPAGLQSAELIVNAGSLTACVPSGTGVRVAWGGALADSNLDDLGLVKLDDNHWATPGLDDSAPAVAIDASANAGEFKLLIGGTCGG